MFHKKHISKTFHVKTSKTAKISIQVGVKALIFDKDNNILLLKCVTRENLNAYWDMPGGRIQGKESLLDNLKREIIEETGIRGVKVLDLLGVQEFTHEDKRIVRLTYVARVTSTPIIKLSEEHSDWGWYKLNEALKMSKLDKYLRKIINPGTNLNKILLGKI